MSGLRSRPFRTKYLLLSHRVKGSNNSWPEWARCGSKVGPFCTFSSFSGLREANELQTPITSFKVESCYIPDMAFQASLRMTPSARLRIKKLRFRSIQDYITSGIGTCAAFCRTNFIALLSSGISWVQYLNLQTALFPVAHTADLVPPSRTSASGSGFERVASGCFVTGLIAYHKLPSFQTAGAVSLGSWAKRHSIVEPKRQW